MAKAKNNEIKESNSLKNIKNLNKIFKYIILVFLAIYLIAGTLFIMFINNSLYRTIFSTIVTYCRYLLVIFIAAFFVTKSIINKREKKNDNEAYSAIDEPKVFKFSKISKKVLKIILIFFAIMTVFNYLISQIPSNDDGWGNLGYIILALLGLYCFIVTLISYGAATLVTEHYANPKKVKSIPGILVSLLAFAGSIMLVVWFLNVFSASFETQTLEGLYDTWYYILIAVLVIVFCVPSFIFLYLSLRKITHFNKIENYVKENKSTIGYISLILVSLIVFIIILINTLTHNAIIIEVDYNTLPTLSQIEAEFKNRNLKSKDSYSQYTAYDSNYEYEYMPNVYQDANTKYPIVIYSSYISYVDDNKTISWDIYCVNGFFYAVIDEISEYKGIKYHELFFTEYARIVSEDEKLMTYNWKKNHFAYGGGILNYKPYSYSFVRHMPTRMVDNSNYRCAKVIKVDRVDSETLDRISIELYNVIKNEN